MRAARVCLVLGLFLARPSAGAGLRDLGEAWLLDGPDLRAVLTGQPAVPGPRWWVSAGSGRLFGMEDLPQMRFETGLTAARGRFQVALAREVLGGELYRETTTEAWLTVGRPLGVSLHLHRTARHLAGVPGPCGLTAGLDLGGTVIRRATWAVRVDVRAGNWALSPGPADVPRRGLARIVMTGPGLGVAATLDRDRSGAPLAGFDLVWRLSGRSALSLRADPSTGNWGPGLTCVLGRLGVRTSHVVHPVLGPSHRVMLTVGMPGARPW